MCIREKKKVVVSVREFWEHPQGLWKRKRNARSNTCLDETRKIWIIEIELCLYIISSNREGDSGVNQKSIIAVTPLILYRFL